RVDFDDPANRPLIERYVVLGLPTTVIVDGQGQQLSRIMGYEGRARYLALLAQEAVDPLPKLEALYRKTPSDDARLALAKALLVRSGASSNRRNRALGLLEPLLWRSELTGPEDRRRRERLGEALFILGRFHHRVRRDPATAQHLWRALAQGCSETSWAGGAWWWFAKSQAELGRPGSGAFALAEQHRRATKPMSTIRQWLRFSEKHHLSDEAQALKDAVKALASSAELSKEQRAQLKRRVMVLGQSGATTP
ncbi:MAG TPA: hypothetical protein DCQ06_02035, partial [Myxococcales bacterium]|nr:hypothetical protein [Myxococcales bacterium]HAN30353.1 hypothetical protein [Myxococcales bacterium]